MKNGFIVIFDIDGTLADTAHRQKYVDGSEKPNWGKFMREMNHDPLHDHVYIVCHALACQGYSIYLVSGRGEEYRKNTEQWLWWNGVYPDHIFMRKEKDSRSDDIVKEEIYNEHLAKDRDKIICVFDDRPKVIRMWRRIGLPVFNCGDGVEF
jgi:phosphoglycolate phosphatase-like HAD superfamily hydrolase